MYEWVSSAIAAGCSIIGVIVGWALNYHSQKNARRMEYLSRAFSDLSRYFLRFVADRSDENLILLASSLESVRLFCSKTAQKEIVEFVHMLASRSIDTDDLTKQYNVICKISRREVQK